MQMYLSRKHIKKLEFSALSDLVAAPKRLRIASHRGDFGRFSADLAIASEFGYEPRDTAVLGSTSHYVV